MAWTFDDPARMLALASALPLILFSIIPLFVRPLKPQHVFFSLFAVSWGLQVAVTSLSQLTMSMALHDALYRSGLFLYLATSLFLVQFSATHPFRNGPTHHLPWLLLPVLLVAPGTLVLFFAPEWVFQTVITPSGPGPEFTIWAPSLVFAPFLLAFYYAAYRQFRLSTTGRSAVARSRARLVAAALGIFVAHVSGITLLSSVDPSGHAAIQAPVVRAVNVALYGAGVLLVITMIGTTLALPGRRRDIDVPMASALAAVLVASAVQHLLARSGIVVETGWLFRVFAAGLLMYALARYRLFDVDVRHRWLLIAAVPAGAMVLATLTVTALVSARGFDEITITVASVLLLAIAWIFRRAPAIAQRLLLVGDGEAAYVYHRKLEVYRAALEERSREAALPPPEDPHLRRMRRRLGLSDSEHHALAYMVDKNRDTTVGLGGATASGAAIAPGRVILGRYRIDRLLGSGQHGRAFLAHDEEDHRAVVVKVVGSTAFGGHAAHLLAREAKILAALDDPHIVRVEACHEGDDRVVLVLEHVEGGDLAGVLQRRGRLGVREATAVMDGILQGLATAHAAGVVHRDLKPENVLVTADGRVKLADFGVARQAGPAATVAAEGGPVGTLLYMSPEQVRGEPVDARSDLYAAGALMHRLVAGRHYIRVAGRDDFQIRRMILEATPDIDRAGLPPALVRWLERALAKDAAARWQNANEMRAALALLERAAAKAAKAESRSVAGAEP